MSLKFSLALIVNVLLGMALITPSHGAEDNLEDYLVPHNKARADLGLPPLTWSPKLTAYAYSVAAMHKDDCKLERSEGPYAENIHTGRGLGMTGTDASRIWVSKKEYYNLRTKTCEKDQDCSDYVNIVAPDARRMGCVKINCSSNDGYIFLCNYSA